MKATGVVRRIDELGRIVIPKEVRRNMDLLEGDPVEIFTEPGSIILRKYFPQCDYSIQVRRIRNSINGDQDMNAGMREAAVEALDKVLRDLEAEK